VPPLDCFVVVAVGTLDVATPDTEGELDADDEDVEELGVVVTVDGVLVAVEGVVVDVDGVEVADAEGVFHDPRLSTSRCQRDRAQSVPWAAAERSAEAPRSGTAVLESQLLAEPSEASEMAKTPPRTSVATATPAFRTTEPVGMRPPVGRGMT
jgi:hypothetical protein